MQTEAKRDTTNVDLLPYRDEAKEWERVFLLESTTGVSSNMTVNRSVYKIHGIKKS